MAPAQQVGLTTHQPQAASSLLCQGDLLAVSSAEGAK